MSEHSGWHEESGLSTAETSLGIHAAHAHGHAAQIRRPKPALAPGASS